MKSKKMFLIIIAFVIGIVLMLLINKLLMLNKFKSEERDLNLESIFSETITISKYNEVSSNEILKYEELSMKNYFVEYIVNQDNPSMKVKYDSNHNIESFYIIDKVQQYIEMLNLNSFNLYEEGDSSNYDFSTNESTKSYLRDRNIENDIDLLNYTKSNYYIKNNIFMNKETIKNNYLINSFVEVTLPEFESVTLINGRLSGYIINGSSNNLKEIHLLNNDTQYIITLSGKSITNDEFIIKLLETIKFI